MDENKNEFENDEMDAIDFLKDLQTAYKPVDELFDMIVDDDGYEDFFLEN